MTAEASFEDLLARVRLGDAAACAEVVRRFEPEVRRFVRYRLTSPRLRRLLDSVDVAQSVFAAFFARAADGQFDLSDPEQLRRLLATMATNRLHDHARRQTAMRRGGAVGVGDTVDEVADSRAQPTAAVEARDLVEAVRDRLDADERGLLDGWMQGQEWAEIAGRAGTTAEAVRKRFTRALDRVARALGLEVEP